MVTKICTVQSFARVFDEPDRVYSVSFRDRHVDNVRRLFFSSFSCQSFPLEPLPCNAIRYLRYIDLLIATTRGRSVPPPPRNIPLRRAIQHNNIIPRSLIILCGLTGNNVVDHCVRNDFEKI